MHSDILRSLLMLEYFSEYGIVRCHTLRSSSAANRAAIASTTTEKQGEKGEFGSTGRQHGRKRHVKQRRRVKSKYEIMRRPPFLLGFFVLTVFLFLRFLAAMPFFCTNALGRERRSRRIFKLKKKLKLKK